VETEDDVLDMIRALPDEINNAGTTTEFKFLTVGGILWECYHEIRYLREELAKAKKQRGKRVRHNT
jgi:hypothetical protein